METASNAGRHRKLDHDDLQYLVQLIRNNPDYFLAELLHMLKTNRFISVHYSTIHDELLRSGISRKRLQKIVKERDEDLRADFITRMAQFAPEELGFSHICYYGLFGIDVISEYGILYAVTIHLAITGL